MVLTCLSGAGLFVSVNVSCFSVCVLFFGVMPFCVVLHSVLEGYSHKLRILKFVLIS